MAEKALELDHVGIKFNLSKEKVDSLKEYVIKLLKKELLYNEFWALQDISFSVEKGERLGILGLNGAGKSTLLKLLLGELSPSSGAVRLLGQDTARFRNWRRLGYVPQDGLARHTDFPASVEEVVLANLSGEIGLFRFPRQEHRERVRQALELVGMAGYGRRLIGALSGGQRQRLSIARALVKKAPVYIFDDTFSALDFKTDAKLRKALAGYTDGATVLIVAQRVSTIMHAEQIVVLDEGRVAGIGTHKQLLETCETYREIAQSQLSKEELA